MTGVPGGMDLAGALAGAGCLIATLPEWSSWALVTAAVITATTIAAAPASAQIQGLRRKLALSRSHPRRRIRTASPRRRLPGDSWLRSRSREPIGGQAP